MWTFDLQPVARFTNDTNFVLHPDSLVLSFNIQGTQQMSSDFSCTKVFSVVLIFQGCDWQQVLKLDLECDHLARKQFTEP